MGAITTIVPGVDFVSIPTRDIAAAAEFYENVLGLERSSAWQRPGEEPLGVEFETETVTIALVAGRSSASRSSRTRSRSRSRSKTSSLRAPNWNHVA